MKCHKCYAKFGNPECKCPPKVNRPVSRNTAEVDMLRLLAQNLYDKADWHLNASLVNSQMADDLMGRVIHRMKSEILADVGRSLDEIADKFGQ